MKRIVEDNELTESPNFDGLPEWVTTAYLDDKLFVDAEDEFTILWVALPFLVGSMRVAIRAYPSSLLIYDETEGYIHVLTEVEYVGPHSRRGGEDNG